MPGLPFTPLWRQEPQTANQRTIQEHEDFLTQLKGPGPRREWIEPMWDQSQQTPQPLNTANAGDPLATYTRQATAQLDTQLAGLASQRAGLEKSLEPDRKAAYESYLIDLQTLNESNMPLEQKRERERALAATYKKKVATDRAKVSNEFEALDQAEQQARAQSALGQILAQAKMESYKEFGEEFGIDPQLIKAAQFKVAGVDMPIARTTQTPMQEWRNTTAIYDRWRNILSKFRQVEIPGELSWGQWAGNKAWFGQPFEAPSIGTSWKAYNPSTRKYDIDVPAGISDYLTQIQAQARETYPRLLELEKQALGRRRLATAGEGSPGPVAQIVQQARTEQPEKVKVRRSDGKLGFIRREQLTEALANGYTQVK